MTSPFAARVSEEVDDHDVFEVVFHGAMRHAFQAWIDEHPAVMVVRTPAALRRFNGSHPDYHEYLVIPSDEGRAKARERGVPPSKVEL